jgi:hypothetical protein
MIDAVFKFFNLEKIDKQFIKKIPYHLFLYILLSIIAISLHFSLDLNKIQIIFFSSLLIFLFVNSLFNHIINGYIKNYMDYAEFDKFISKLSDILDGKYSPFSEGYNKKRVATLFLLIITSGFSLMIFVLSVISLIFYFSL